MIYFQIVEQYYTYTQIEMLKNKKPKTHVENTSELINSDSID